MAALIHTARVRARDEIATMFCKRMAAIHKRARERLEQLREETRAESERLLDTFGEVLAGVREALGVSPGEQDSGGADATEEVCARAGQLVLGALGQVGGVAALSAAHETVTAHHGNNYLPLVERFCRSSRPVMSGVLDVLVLRSASADTSLLDAIRFLCASHGRTGEYIPAHEGGKEIDLSSAPEAWRKIITDRRRPGRLVRRHFEACVFSCLAAELRSGDIAVAGSESYANFADQLLSSEECEPLIGAYCTEAGLPAGTAEASAALRAQLEETVARVFARSLVKGQLVAALDDDDTGDPRDSRPPSACGGLRGRRWQPGMLAGSGDGITCAGGSRAAALCSSEERPRSPAPSLAGYKELRGHFLSGRSGQDLRPCPGTRPPSSGLLQHEVERADGQRAHRVDQHGQRLHPHAEQARPGSV